MYITEDDSGDWGAEIGYPDEGMVLESFNTIEEAKDYCERKAAQVQSEK